MNPELPPSQQLVAPGKWPVVGEKEPRPDDSPWLVTVGGLVQEPRSWSLEDLRAMPQVEREIDIHCVTRWSRPQSRFAGVPLSVLLDSCRPLSTARFVSFVARSARNHSTSLAMPDTVSLNPLVALSFEGSSLSMGHGGPVRIVTPGRYFYKSVKWLERIDLLAEDRPGYWEGEAGYHNIGDPWSEQRYLAPNVDRRVLADALARRDFSGLDLRSVDLRGRDLRGLVAKRALLRDADFRQCSLAEARFDGANLSNAHLNGADLRGASFVEADVEGADLCGADLRGAIFTGASLFGATFVGDPGDRAAVIGAETRIDEAGIESLTPVQREFVLRCFGG